MMDRSGFLPDASTLEALLQAAGLVGPSRAEGESRLEFVRFPDHKAPIPAPPKLPPAPSAPAATAPPAPAPAAAVAPDAQVDLADLDDGWGGNSDITNHNFGGTHTKSRINLPPLEHVDKTPPKGLASLKTVEQRLSLLVDWLMGSTASYSAFVADSEGLALANRNAPDNYVAATAMIGRAQHLLDEYVPAPVDGATSMELEDGNTLQIVWASTDAGRLAAGMVLPQPLARTFCVTVRNMVRAAVANEEMR